jgi:hypothetical protein
LAAAVASLVVSVSAVVFVTKTPEAGMAIVYLFAMLIAGAVNDVLGIHLGIWKNGFFIPTPAGYVVAAILSWLAIFLTIWLLSVRSGRESGKSSRTA